MECTFNAYINYSQISQKRIIPFKMIKVRRQAKKLVNKINLNNKEHLFPKHCSRKCRIIFATKKLVIQSEIINYEENSSSPFQNKYQGI